MSFIFGGTPPTVAEMARKYKMDINRQIRELQRESQKLSVEEKSLFSDMKKAVTTNPKVAMQKAKAVVRVRRIASRFSTMQGNLQGVHAKISNMKSMEALTRTMQQVSTLMSKFNETPALKAMPHTLTTFARENAAMMLKSEIMDDAMDDIFDENEDEESDELIGDVFAEAGITFPTMAKASENIEETFARLKVAKQGIPG